MSNFSTARTNFQDGAQKAAHDASEVIREKAAQASEALRDGTERIQAEAGAMARKTGEKVTQRVTERPLTTLAATLAVGAVAGYLLGRR